MKCEHAERKVLLNQTGELGFFGRNALWRHLNACAHCRQFETDMNLTMSAVRSWQTPSADDTSLAAIRNAARAGASRSEEFTFKPSVKPVLLWRPLVLYAAAALLLMTGLYMTNQRLHTATPVTVAHMQTAPADANSALSWDDDMDEAITSLGTSMARAGDESSATDMDSMARELLKLEDEQI